MLLSLEVYFGTPGSGSIGQQIRGQPADEDRVTMKGSNSDDSKISFFPSTIGQQLSAALLRTMGAASCAIHCLSNEIAKTKLKGPFSITFAGVGVNSKARFRIEYIAISYDFAKLRTDPETEMLLSKIIDRLQLS